MAEKKKVLITLHHLGPRVVPVVRQLEAEGFEVLHNSIDRSYTEAELLSARHGVFGAIAGGESYTEESGSGLVVQHPRSRLDP